MIRKISKWIDEGFGFGLIPLLIGGMILIPFIYVGYTLQTGEWDEIKELKECDKTKECSKYKCRMDARRDIQEKMFEILQYQTCLMEKKR